MADSPFRNQPLRVIVLVLTLAGVFAGLILFFIGLVMLFKESTSLPWIGLTILLQSFFAYVILDAFFRLEMNVNQMREATSRTRSAVEESSNALKRMEPMVKTISVNSQISDATKSIANREVEHEVLRQAIREEMLTGEIDAAQYLITEMERRFGYHQEAQKLRDEMSQMREMTIEDKITEAITHITKMMDENRWVRAAKEAERLLKLFPKHDRIAALPGELNRRREARKQELLKQWKLAVEREEVDRAIAVLTELDQYLGKDEAQALQDSVRHVFKSHLVNLGVQFGLAVSEARWRDALEVGVQIRQAFPNSRMAHEVAAKLETLRMRAGFGADADIVIQRRDVQPAQQPAAPAQAPQTVQVTQVPQTQSAPAPSPQAPQAQPAPAQPKATPPQP